MRSGCSTAARQRQSPSAGHARFVIVERFVGLDQIAGPILTAVVGERPIEHLGQLQPAVVMGGSGKAGGDFQQNDAICRASGNLHPRPAQFGMDETPRPDLATRHGRRQGEAVDAGRRRGRTPPRLAGAASMRAKISSTSAGRISAGGRSSSSAPPAASNARVSRRQCGQDSTCASRPAEGRAETSGGVAQQGFIAGMLAGAHAVSSSNFLSRASASRTRDFTVPSGTPSSWAMADCGLSAK